VSELNFTTGIIEQTDKVLKECRKLQILLDNKVPDTVFIWCFDEFEVNTILYVFRKEKRTGEENVAEDDDENKDVEVKPKHNVIFKVD
jgi:hypothetical protein